MRVCRYTFDVARRRWYALEVKEKDPSSSAEQRRARRKQARAAAGGDDSASVFTRTTDVFEDEEGLGEGGSDDEGENVKVDAFDDNAFYYWENGELKRMDMSEADGDGDEGGDAPSASEPSAAPVEVPVSPLRSDVDTESKRDVVDTSTETDAVSAAVSATAGSAHGGAGSDVPDSLVAGLTTKAVCRVCIIPPRRI